MEKKRCISHVLQVNEDESVHLALNGTVPWWLLPDV